MDNEGNWKGSDSPFVGGERETGFEEQARSTAEKARTEVRSLAEAGREEIAGQVSGIARALRNVGDQLRGDEHEQIGHYSELLGDQADRVARYLNEHDTNALLGEVEDFARRRPLLFLGGCVAIGFAVGRFFKASPPEEGGRTRRSEEDVGGRSPGIREGAYETGGFGTEEGGWLARSDRSVGYEPAPVVTTGVPTSNIVEPSPVIGPNDERTEPEER